MMCIQNPVRRILEVLNITNKLLHGDATINNLIDVAQEECEIMDKVGLIDLLVPVMTTIKCNKKQMNY
ncbi:hypothetical protein AXE85_02340 [Gemella sp. oral taxon 928]|nr:MULTISPECIES: hypothetical protein [Gemella]AME09080.1 hypothetical protein AXE85_02340 [Gemella sp. oral taxon 928]